MAEENPAFAAAVAVSYSLEHGKVADAAIGETAWRVMAAQLLARAPLPGLDYAPFLARAAALRATALGHGIAGTERFLKE